MRLLRYFIILFWLICSIALAQDGYTTQVGDIIRISLPGEDSFKSNFTIDRQGKIDIPELGRVELIGLNETQMQEKIKTQLNPLYQDLLNLKVYVYQRKLVLNVLGYVNAPGEINLPAGSTIQHALQAAGGLKTGAQLDKIQLRRKSHDKTETLIFNYKYYLDTGDSSELPSLESLDLVFIPSSPMTGNVEVEFDPSKIADSGDAATDKQAIKVFGEVNSPGSFSYKKGLTLLDLLMRAGGVTRYAGVEKIRVITQGSPVQFNLKHYLDTGDSSQIPTLELGSTIFVPRQEEEIKSGANMVYIMGEVAQPGAYEGNNDATFMDILANAGGPTRFAESRQIRVLKESGEIIPFDLSAYTEGLTKQGPPVITPGDAIFVPEKTDMNEKSWLKVAPSRAVRVIGEVLRPGRIEWSDEMSLLDLLAHVGGPTSRADTSNIEIMTPGEKDKAKNTITTFNLDQYMQLGTLDDALPTIAAGATIRIHDLPQDPSDNKAQWVRQSSEKSIYVLGQVVAPGRYMFTEEMHFLDILAAADGPNANGDIHNIRISHRNKKYAKVTKLNLALYFETGDENLLPEVTMGDTIYIPEKNRVWLDKSKESTIRVLGEINKPGRYKFNDNMTILDLLAEAGGANNRAYLEKITVVNLSCCKNQSQTFDLTEFARTGDYALLPVIRAGDTVYIPDQGASSMEKARVIIRDVVELVSLTKLLGVF